MAETQPFSYRYSPSPDEERIRKLRSDSFALLGGMKTEYRRKETQEDLRRLRSELERLGSKHGNDQELADLRALFKDIAACMDSGFRDPLGFRSVQQITARVKKEVRPYIDGDQTVRIEALAEQHPEYRALIGVAEKMNPNEIDHISLSGNPQGPTILIAPQLHYDLDDELVIAAKQVYAKYGKTNLDMKYTQDSHARIIKAIGSITPQIVYLELVESRRRPTKKELSKYLLTDKRWGLIFKGTVIEGIEDRAPIEAPLATVSDESWHRLRLNIGNIFLTDSIVDDLLRNGRQTGAVVIGHMHEDKKEGIPTSALLAAAGINVIVMKPPKYDTSSALENDTMILINAIKVARVLSRKVEAIQKGREGKLAAKADPEALISLIRQIIREDFPKTEERIRTGKINERIFTEIVSATHEKIKDHP